MSLLARDAAADAVAGLLAGGSMRVLTVDDRLLVTLALASPAAAPSSDGLVAVHDPLPGVAVDSGRAHRVELRTASGLLVHSGVIGSEYAINGAAIAIGATVRCSGLTLKEPL